MRHLVLAAIVAVCLGCNAAQAIKFGGCADVPVMSSFDLSKYTGLWYEIEKNPTIFEADTKCNSATYEDKGDYVSVVNRAVRVSSGDETSIQGKATVVDKNEPAKLTVTFDNVPFGGDYWVLDTDYENYSLVYSCFDVFKVVKAEYLWILSRKPTLDDGTRTKIYQFLDDKKINRSNLKATTQDCS